MSTHWPPVSQDQLASPGLDPKSEFKFSCTQVGTCCFGTPVLINPGDVWALANNQELMSRFGYQTTRDLFHDKPDRQAPFALYLGEHSNLPVCSINQVELFPGAETEKCPFVTPVYQISSQADLDKLHAGQPSTLHKSSDGSDRPVFLCGIHESRPTICRSYPLGRFSLQGLPEDGKTFKMSGGKTQIIDNSHGCNECWGQGDKIAGREKMLASPDLWSGTIKEWLEKTGVQAGWEITDLWWVIMDKLNIPDISNSLRFAIGLLSYDFDGAWVAQDMTLEEVYAKRPSSIEMHLSRIDNLVDAFVAGVTGNLHARDEAMHLLAEHGIAA